MKKTDLAMIVLIASISILAAYFVANAFLGGKDSESVTVKTTDPIATTVTAPDSAVFNKDAINPTVEVIIGQGSSPQGSQ